MDFEAIPLYNKIILGPATPTKVRKVTNKHVLQKQKKCDGKIQSGANKKGTVRVSIKEAFKKENKQIRPERTRLLQKTQKILRTSGLYGIGTFRHRGKYPKTSDNHPGWT